MYLIWVRRVVPSGKWYGPDRTTFRAPYHFPCDTTRTKKLGSNAEWSKDAPTCPSEPPNNASALEIEEWSCLEQTTTTHLIETEPVHSHDEPDSLAAHGYARWTIFNRSS